MGKGPSQPAVWLLLYKNVAPKRIVSLGYKSSLVYSYNARMPAAMVEFRQKMEELRKVRK